jgi:hypothetical protein
MPVPIGEPVPGPASVPTGDGDVRADVPPMNADFHGRKNNQSSDACRGQW